MPIYEYRCSKCRTRFEVLLLNHDEPPATCEKCGGKLVKLVSAPAIQFKGSGWYVTDYAKKDSGQNGHCKSRPAEKKAEETTAPKTNGND